MNLLQGFERVLQLGSSVRQRVYLWLYGLNSCFLVRGWRGGGGEV